MNPEAGLMSYGLFYRAVCITKKKERRQNYTTRNFKNFTFHGFIKGTPN